MGATQVQKARAERLNKKPGRPYFRIIRGASSSERSGDKEPLLGNSARHRTSAERALFRSFPPPPLDGPIHANRFADSRESFQGSRTEPLLAHRVLDRLNHMKIEVFLRIDSHESIRANRTDSRCESPGHLSSPRKEARKLEKKSPRHRPGVPGTPGGTTRGPSAGVPGIPCCLLWKN